MDANSSGYCGDYSLTVDAQHDFLTVYDSPPEIVLWLIDSSWVGSYDLVATVRLASYPNVAPLNVPFMIIIYCAVQSVVFVNPPSRQPFVLGVDTAPLKISIKVQRSPVCPAYSTPTLSLMPASLF